MLTGIFPPLIGIERLLIGIFPLRIGIGRSLTCIVIGGVMQTAYGLVL